MIEQIELVEILHKFRPIWCSEYPKTGESDSDIVLVCDGYVQLTVRENQILKKIQAEFEKQEKPMTFLGRPIIWNKDVPEVELEFGDFSEYIKKEDK